MAITDTKQAILEAIAQSERVMIAPSGLTVEQLFAALVRLGELIEEHEDAVVGLTNSVHNIDVR